MALQILLHGVCSPVLNKIIETFIQNQQTACFLTDCQNLGQQIPGCENSCGIIGITQKNHLGLFPSDCIHKACIHLKAIFLFQIEVRHLASHTA